MLPKRKLNEQRVDNTYIVMMGRMVGDVESVLHIHVVAEDFAVVMDEMEGKMPGWNPLAVIPYADLPGRIEDLDFVDHIHNG